MHHTFVPRTLFSSALALGVVAILLSAALGQSTGGRILGRVADQTGHVIEGAKVTLTAEATGVNRVVRTDGNGDYVFVEAPPGTYHVEFEQSGFKKNIVRDVLVELNQVITLNSILQVGTQKEIIDVTGEAPLVDTTTTQLGAVVNNRSVNELPLNARDSYQFLQLQPGVQAQLGSSASILYGGDAAGSVSVNGGRGRANNFSVNGGDANDQFVNAAAVQPTPDAIEEFRMITNTFDAEYGRNSGAVVNVVTKSGGNAFHGDVYEYFRNKVLNAQGYFNTINPQFNQNQFGGTFGGPIKKNRTFFFVTYEGRRIRQGISGDIVAIPTPAEIGGDFSQGGQAVASSLTSGLNFGGQISDQFVADALKGRPGCQAAILAQNPKAVIQAGAYYGAHLQNPNDPASAVLPGIFSVTAPGLSGLDNQIPRACMDPVAVNLLSFVPPANRPDGTYQGVPTKADDQNQFTARIDHRITDHQNLSVYYYFTDERIAQPYYDFQGSGANVPGFGSLVRQRFQQWNPSHTWTLSNSLVNEFRFTYMREGQLTFQHPQVTGAVTSFCTGAAAAYCFNGVSDSSAINNLIASWTPKVLPGRAGITPGLPTSHTGLPFVGVYGGFNIGNGWEGELPQVGNSFQWSDNLSWVKSGHTMKFGADIRRARFDQTYYYEVNGDFTFDSSSNNAVTYADNYPGYFLGLADVYAQGSSQREGVRSTGVYLFAQDSWKIRQNVTLNYGVRWELDTPLTDILGHVQTFRPGENSKVYPCAITPAGASSPLDYCPTGLVVPGDPGVPAGMTSTYYKAFAPRAGLSYSPNFTSGFLGKIFGSKGRSSVRAGWGLFYNPMEQLVLAQFGAEPPFGSSPSFYNTFFNTPFVYQSGNVAPNGFNGVLTPPKGQDPGWANYTPILLYGDFQPHLRTQYTAQYNFSLQRELVKNLLWQVNYVGSQGHRLLASHDINPGNPQTCWELINLGQGCGPTLEDNTYQFTLSKGTTFTLPNGQVITGSPTGTPIFLPGTRPYSAPNCVEYSTSTQIAGTNCPSNGSPVFTNIFAEDTIANSAYNSLQTMLEKRMSHGLQFQAAYTLSKSLDWASSFEETLNPFDLRKSRALSLFNSAQRFVINYVWDIPMPQYHGIVGKLLDDWEVSGITQFQSGFPIRLQTQNDNELIGSLFFFGTAAPQMTGSVPQLQNPKVLQSFSGVTGHFYLTPSQFADPLQSTFATTPRSICCGPGLNQWDITVEKKIAITEAKYFEFRTDVFNVANKSMFDNPDGNFSSSTFGQVLHARDPRLVQFALKFYF